MSVQTKKIPLWVRGMTVVTAVAVALLLFLTRSGDAWNLFSYDLMFLLRGARPSPQNIVVIGIDEESFDEINIQWPWPRGLHAKLLDKLFEAGATTVAFDLLFAEPSTEIEDQKLADAIQRHHSVVLAREVEGDHDRHTGTGFSSLKIIDPVPIIDLLPKHFDKVLLGRVNPDADGDGFVRRVDVGVDANESEVMSFAEVAAEQFAISHNQSLPEGSIGGERWIDFLGPAGTVQLVPYHLALEPETTLPPGFFKDKLVFVGFVTYSSAAPQNGLVDHFSMPFSRWDGHKMAGVELHAQTAANVLGGQRISWFDSDKLYIISGGLGLALGLVLVSFSPVIAIAVFIPTVIAGLILSFYLFASLSIFLSPAVLLSPLSAVMLISPILHYVFVSKQRSFVKKAFATYLSPRLVEQLLEHPDQIDLSGEEREGTLLFLDLEGFTAFSEKLSPKELIQLINRTLGAFAEIVLKWDGMIDKYIGDALMAVWGVPIHDPEHALKAALAAKEIQKKAIELAALELQRTGITLGVRIGINSGTFVAGNVGGGQQFNYTVLGNEVNLASRLESINKVFGSKVIVSDRTVSRLGSGSVEKGVILRELDSIRVKGQKSSVTIFELCADTSLAGKCSAVIEPFGEVRQTINARYSEALTSYRKRSWREALGLFQQVLEISPSDLASKLMVERCEKYLVEPPPEDWDGITTMTEK